MLLLLLNGCALVDALGDSSKNSPVDGGGGGDSTGDGGNAWVALHPLLGPRSGSHVAVVGTDIYAISGSPNRPSNERYSTTSDSWDIHAEIPIATGRSGVASVGDFIYVSGGILASSNCSNDQQRYDTVNGVWSSLFMLPSSYCRHGMVAIGNKLWLTGGNIQNMISYDVMNDSYAFAAASFPPPSIRQFPMVAAIGNKVYLLGGTDPGSVSMATADVYDTTTDSWESETPLPLRRNEAGVAVVGTKIFLIGGRKDMDVLDSVDILDTTTHQWSPGPPLPQPLFDVGAVAIGNSIYAVGGSTGPTEVDTIYKLTVN